MVVERIQFALNEKVNKIRSKKKRKETFNRFTYLLGKEEVGYFRLTELAIEIIDNPDFSNDEVQIALGYADRKKEKTLKEATTIGK